MTITKILSDIQQKLKAPKNQKNTFGGYNYRSCEDILEAVKPLLGEACLTISDDIVQIGDRFYIKAVAKLSLGDESIENAAFAREPLAKKGMDEAQVTGATSSYARKYALNGLFAIDDTKDADAIEPAKPKAAPKQAQPQPKPQLTFAERVEKFKAFIKSATLDDINKASATFTELKDKADGELKDELLKLWNDRCQYLMQEPLPEQPQE